MEEDPSYTRSGTNSHEQSGHHCTCTQAELHTHAYSNVYPWTLMRGSHHHMMQSLPHGQQPAPSLIFHQPLSLLPHPKQAVFLKQAMSFTPVIALCTRFLRLE